MHRFTVRAFSFGVLSHYIVEAACEASALATAILRHGIHPEAFTAVCGPEEV